MLPPSALPLIDVPLPPSAGSALVRRAFPDAFTVRCFAFEPGDEQVAEDRKASPNFIMFPPGEPPLL